jgi:hypothetical protein
MREMRAQRFGPTAIAKALGIGRASGYSPTLADLVPRASFQSESTAPIDPAAGAERVSI